MAGMTANNLLMQSLARLLTPPVMRPIVAEHVSLGEPLTRPASRWLWPNTDSLTKNWHKAAERLPSMDIDLRDRGYRKWKEGGGARGRLGRRRRNARSARPRDARILRGCRMRP